MPCMLNLYYSWLGWSSNLGPAATLFGQLYTQAGSPAYVRGLATNVANYKFVEPPPT
jgi:cellulase/cellobiase CelA1